MGTTSHQKSERVLRLLLSLRRQPIAAALAAHGFDHAEIDEGFRLLRAMTVADVVDVPEVGGAGREARIEEWTRRWFPILGPALRRRHPEVAAQLFPELTKAANSPYVAAETFLRGFDALGNGTLPPAENDAARALMVRRGLDETALGALRALLAVEKNVAWPKQDFEDAERQLWAWYGEWSGVVRSRVKDLRLLRELGLRHDTEGP